MSAVQGKPVPTTQAAPQIITRTTILRVLTLITVLAVAFGAYMALAYAGTDVTQGEVQRIFYFHVPAFAGAFVALSGTVIGGVMYLRTRQTKWDTLALAGVEVGLTLGTMNLVTGMIWARPIWNTWWTWDPRLTSSAIMVLTYAAYLMLRNGIENMDTRRRFASIYGILAISTVIITLVITRIRPDTIHPVVIGPSPQNAQGEFEFGQAMKATVGLNSAIWSILIPLTLMWWRIRLENVVERVRSLKSELLNQ